MKLSAIDRSQQQGEGARGRLQPGFTWPLTCDDTSAQPEGKNVKDGNRGGGEECVHRVPDFEAVLYKRNL